MHSLCAGLATSVQAMSLSITPAQTAAWRKQIFEQLSERSKREMENFKHYEQAIEQVLLPASLAKHLNMFSGFILFLSSVHFSCSPSVLVCLGEKGLHAVVEGLETSQVVGCAVCPGAVLRSRGQQRWHPVHILYL